MGKKSTPKAPPAPDYAGAAQAQGQANLDAARIGAELTNTNQYTPYGNQVFTKDPGSDQWSSTITLSPEQQRLYDLQNQGDQALGETAVAQLDRVRQSMSQPLDLSGAPERVNSIDPTNYSIYSGSGPQYSRVGAAGAYENLGAGPAYGTVGSGPTLGRADSGPAMGRADSGPAMNRLGTGPEYAKYNEAIANLPDYAQQAQQVEDSLYRSATARLDPEFTQAENAERQRLINAGVAEDSEMWRNSMDTFNRNKQSAYGDARDRAIQGRGQEQSRLNNDFYTGNAQRFGQTLQSLGFNNDSSARQFADAQTTAGFNNQAGQQEFANRLASLGVNNQAGQQEFANRLASLGVNNQAGQQEFANQMSATGFNNAAGQQAFQDAATSAGFNNATQAQRFADALRGTEFNNAASGQEFEDQLRALGFNNTAEAQQFADAIAGGNFQNTQRGAAIDEAAYLRSDPLNMYNALSSGAQVTNPTFRGTGQVQGPAAAPVFAGVQAADQRAVDMYNARLAQQGSAQGGLFGLLGTLGGAAIGAGGIFGK